MNAKEINERGLAGLYKLADTADSDVAEAIDQIDTTDDGPERESAGIFDLTADALAVVNDIWQWANTKEDHEDELWADCFECCCSLLNALTASRSKEWPEARKHLFVASQMTKSIMTYFKKEA